MLSILLEQSFSIGLPTNGRKFFQAPNTLLSKILQMFDVPGNLKQFFSLLRVKVAHDFWATITTNRVNVNLGNILG